MADIQTTYPQGQELGQVGQKARTSAPFDGDRIQIGTGGALKAGDSFRIVAGKAEALSADAAAEQVEGVLMYEAGALNDETTGLIGAYAADEFVPYCVGGYVYAVAGSTGVTRGASVLLDISEHDWITTGAPAVGQNKALTAVTAAADGELFVLSVGARHSDRIV